MGAQRNSLRPPAESNASVHPRRGIGGLTGWQAAQGMELVFSPSATPGGTDDFHLSITREGRRCGRRDNPVNFLDLGER